MDDVLIHCSINIQQINCLHNVGFLLYQLALPDKGNYKIIKTA